MKKVLVLGGGYAGTLAALRLARRTKTTGVEVTLIDVNEAFTERIRLHQVAAGSELRRYPYAELLRRQRARFLHGRVMEIDPAGHTARVEPTSAGSRQREATLSYDRLVYALGSRTGTSGIPGVADHAFTLGDWQAARRLSMRLRQLDWVGGRALVIGGGLTGVECAAELAERYSSLHVKIVTAGTIVRRISERGRDDVRRSLGRLGVNVREQAAVRAVGDRVAQFAGGDETPFDVCVWAGPFVPYPLGATSGLATNEFGQVRVDPSLRSISHPEVYAVGDGAAVDGAPLRMACATAMPMGAHAADNVAAGLNGRPSTPFRLGYLAQCISLGRREGLIQRVASDDTPRDRILTGLSGARVKEMVSRVAFSSLVWEGRGAPYVWPKADVQRVR